MGNDEARMSERGLIAELLHVSSAVSTTSAVLNAF